MLNKVTPLKLVLCKAFVRLKSHLQMSLKVFTLQYSIEFGSEKHLLFILWFVGVCIFKIKEK